MPTEVYSPYLSPETLDGQKSWIHTRLTWVYNLCPHVHSVAAQHRTVPGHAIGKSRKEKSPCTIKSHAGQLVKIDNAESWRFVVACLIEKYRPYRLLPVSIAYLLITQVGDSLSLCQFSQSRARCLLHDIREHNVT